MHPIFDPLPPPGYSLSGLQQQPNPQQALTPQNLLHPSTTNIDGSTLQTQSPGSRNAHDSRLSNQSSHALPFRRRQTSLLTEIPEDIDRADFALPGHGVGEPQYALSDSSASTYTQRWSFATTASEASTIRTSLSISPYIPAEVADEAALKLLRRQPTQPSYHHEPRMENLLGVSMSVTL